MAVRRFQVRCENSAVNALNHQELGFTFHPDNVWSDAAIAARLIAYMAQCAVCAGGTTIVAIMARDATATGYTAVPYPAAEYATINADAVADGFTTQPGTGAFPFALGIGALCPLGTSISVSERTATAGPTGRGRHFLPFISAAVVNAGGQLSSVYRTAVLNAYNELFFAVDPSGGAAAGSLAVGNLAVVANAAGVVGGTISSIMPQPVFSNLESRRR